MNSSDIISLSVVWLLRPSFILGTVLLLSGLLGLAPLIHCLIASAEMLWFDHVFRRSEAFFLYFFFFPQGKIHILPKPTGVRLPGHRVLMPEKGRYIICT